MPRAAYVTAESNFQILPDLGSGQGVMPTGIRPYSHNQRFVQHPPISFDPL